MGRTRLPYIRAAPFMRNTTRARAQIRKYVHVRLSPAPIAYRRTGFNCETLIIANCEIISSSQKLKRKQKFTQSKSRGLVLHLETVSSFQFSVLRRYFKPANKLPTADKAGLSANVVKEVNQVVTRTLERSEASAEKTKVHDNIHA